MNKPSSKTEFLFQILELYILELYGHWFAGVELKSENARLGCFGGLVVHNIHGDAAIDDVGEMIAAGDHDILIPIFFFDDLLDFIAAAHCADDADFAIGLNPGHLPALRKDATETFFVKNAGESVGRFHISLIPADHEIAHVLAAVLDAGVSETGIIVGHDLVREVQLEIPNFAAFPNQEIVALGWIFFSRTASNCSIFNRPMDLSPFPSRKILSVEKFGETIFFFGSNNQSHRRNHRNQTNDRTAYFFHRESAAMVKQRAWLVHEKDQRGKRIPTGGLRGIIGGGLIWSRFEYLIVWREGALDEGEKGVSTVVANKSAGRTGLNKREVRRRYPIGAETQKGGGAHFRVWAPKSKSAAVQLVETGTTVPLNKQGDGYFYGFIAEARNGSLYKIKLDSGSFPDPMSRFQPQGPHGPSQVVDPSLFHWKDQKWTGVSRRGQIIYEMHIGTFTPEGTWRAAMEQLKELAELGVTMLEILPLADFQGLFGWGYDGVNMFAPTRLYGTPDEVREFINRAHQLGLGVILDVVYNHFGPDGNYLGEFSKDYLSHKYDNEWGDPINFDDTNSGPVREFFITNARYWIEEFHFDGLRLDATQQIFDETTPNILAEITQAVRDAGGGRSTYVVGENECQHTHLMRSCEKGGFGMDSLWNDDFHHSAMVALTGRDEAYYTDHCGKPQEFISAVKWGYLYQGQWYTWQKQRRGAPALDLDAEQFVIFLQNHDQVANSLRGQRIHQLTSPGHLKAMTALLLLAPGTPMLFQGQEFAASTPFLYFADHNPELDKLVAEGRRKFLKQFPSIACEECQEVLAPPGDKKTFEKCKLDFSEREKNGSIYQFHKDLLHLRRNDRTIRESKRGKYDGAVLGEEAFCVRFFGVDCDDRLLLVNLGRDLRLDAAPEPLLACTLDHQWALIWSSENPIYGGGGTPPIENAQSWHIPGHATVLLAARPMKKGKNGKAGAKD
jgi:maltooligosyltrehalose trehalohydrolase